MRILPDRRVVGRCTGSPLDLASLAHLPREAMSSLADGAALATAEGVLGEQT